MAVIFEMDYEWAKKFPLDVEYYSDADKERDDRYWKKVEEKNRQAFHKAFYDKTYNTTFMEERIEHPRSAEDVTQVLRLISGDHIPDDTLWLRGYFSKKFKSIVEQHEPAGAGFQFFPVKIYDRQDNLISEEFYYWDVFRRIDAIDPESPAIKTVAGPADGRHRWTIGSTRSTGVRPTKENLRVRKEVMGDFAVWRDYRYDPSKIFMSDAVFDDLMAAGLQGHRDRSHAFMMQWCEV